MTKGQVREKHLVVKKLTVAGRDVTGGVVLAADQLVDLNGEPDALVLDADGDTTLSAPTDDQIDVEIAGANDFEFTANTFTALDGSKFETDTINETGSGAGVTVDGALLKDRTSDLGRRVQQLTASDAFTIDSGLLLLNHATVVIEATLDAPAAGDEFFIVNNSASGTAAHTVTLDGVTFDAAGNDVATFDAPGEALHLIALSATRWLILENIGSVGLSGA